MSTPKPQPVLAYEETVIIPSYTAPAPDPNPMYLDRRVNQGASGRVYPNPFTDRVANEPEDRAYQAVWLENDYVQLMILPELGGRIQTGYDKTSGYDFLYRQHVIKPALIGLCGSWISGGMEFNWPMHHRPSTHVPVDHTIEEHTDGSRTVWLSDHEPMDRTKGMLGICLHPGKAYFEFKVQLYNRTPFPQTFLWWVNVGVHKHEQYQVFFPPDVVAVTDHSKRAMSHFPVSRGKYYGTDLDGVDISWPSRIPPAASYFAWESSEDFFGGYDHRADAGLVHVANHHISPGKKMFTWGTADFAQAWERNLTDEDGPYIELMAGVYTDNQPDFSWIQPYETKVFSQYWYPIQRIGPPKKANQCVAINLEIEQGQAKIGVLATETFERARIALCNGDATLWEQQVDLAPAQPLLAQVELRAGTVATDLVLTVSTASGRELIRYTPIILAEEPLPEPMMPPPPAKEIDNIEELYLTGIHLEQYKHPLLEPEPYWERALEMDPSDARSNNALGLSLLRRGKLQQAESYLRRSIATLTRRNPNPRDGEAYHNLGLALKYQGQLDQAYQALYKGIWSYAWQAPGYYALAEIDGLRADWAAALEHSERSLVTNALNLKARNLKTAALRRMGRLSEADAMAQGTKSLDPLDYWSRNEALLLARAQEDTDSAQRLESQIVSIMQGDRAVEESQRYLDLALDYGNAGLYEEASDVLARLVDKSVSGRVYPMVLYALGYYAHRMRDAERGLGLYRKAATMPPDYCFPVRLEEMAILEHVVGSNPQDGRACYYLGNLLYDKKRQREAMALWERATQLEPGFSIPWRNLGLAHYNVEHDTDRAKACYAEAIKANPGDARLISEMDQVFKRAGATPAQRLAFLEEHLDLVAERDDLCMERAALHNLLNQPERALEIVMARQFHPWEGGEGHVSDQYVAAHVALSRAALAAGNPRKALDHSEAARTLPQNLGEGRHAGASLADLDYLSGLAHRALGDGASATECWKRAAQPQDGFSPMTYYQAMAMSELGDKAGSREKLDALKRYAREQLEAVEKPGFHTSLPEFLFYEQDSTKPSRVAHTYLLGLAALGLGDRSEARNAFEAVLAADSSHLGAHQQIAALAKSE